MGNKIVIGFKTTEDKFQPELGNYLYYENLYEYIDEIESYKNNNYCKTDIFIINAELFSESLKPVFYKGIDLVEWIRVKLRLLNPILVFGFTPLEQLISLKPESIIIFGENILYRQLPFSIKQIEKLTPKLFPLESEKDLVTFYKDIVKKTFDIKGFEHSFANKYGIRLMKEAFETTTNEKFQVDESNSIKTTLDFSKADFLYRINSDDGDSYFKSQIIDRTGKGSLTTFRDLMSKGNRIFHIDDEGDTQKWYDFVKVLGKLNDGNYKSISKGKLLINDRINTEFVLNEIELFQPNLILIDLRLLGQKESNVQEFYDYTGAILIEDIRKINPWIPIVIISATSQLKSLENLQEYPYNITSLWSKPRVDSGVIDIYEKLDDLLAKINSALKLYSNEAEKWITEAQYRIIEKESVMFNADFIDQYDEFIFDANYFCETSDKIINHHLYFSKLIKYLAKKNKSIIIIDDVLSEVFLNSIKKNSEEFKKISQFSLNRLIMYRKDGRIMRKDRLINNLIDKKLVPEFEENSDGKFDIYFSLKIKQESCRQEINAIDKVESYRQELIQTSNIHADNIFKFLINHLVKFRNKKVLFVSDDLICKREIGLRMAWKGVKINDHFFRENIQINRITTRHSNNLNFKDNNGVVKCSLMKNQAFISKITKLN